MRRQIDRVFDQRIEQHRPRRAVMMPGLTEDAGDGTHSAIRVRRISCAQVGAQSCRPVPPGQASYAPVRTPNLPPEW